MLLLELLKKVFLIVFPISLTITTILSAIETFGKGGTKNKTETTSNNQKMSTEDKIYILILCSILFCLAVGIVLLWINYSKYHWIFLILALPVYLGYITGALRSISILGNVISGQNDNSLSPQENLAIQTIAYVIFFLNFYNLPAFLANKIAQFTNNAISDLALALLYVIVSFIYIFFIMALLPKPLFFCIKTIKMAVNRFKFKSQVVLAGNFFAERAVIKFPEKSILVNYYKCIKCVRYPIKAFLCILIPLVYVVDIGFQLLLISFSILVSIIGYIVILFRIAIDAIKKMFTWILELSDKRIVSVSFRLALIAAFVSVVILNRYQPIFKEYEKSTAIFEFLASSIIIPVIFEWIYSFKYNRKRNETI